MKLLSGFALSFLFLGSHAVPAQNLDLPTGRQLVGTPPGHPQRLNSLPISMAVSPGGRFLVTVNAGFGTFESKYEQSLAVLDTRTGALRDFPDARTHPRLPESLYSGLAFSPGGRHIYASMASMSAPEGNDKGSPGNGIAVYSFQDGSIAPERFLPIPLQQLAPGRTTQLPGGKPGGKAIPYPAAIAVLGAGKDEKLLVANNLADNVVLLDATSGKIERSFDLSESAAVPATYPIALAVDKDGKRAFAALWNASQVVELDLKSGKVGRKLDLLKPSNPIAAGTHPSAFAFSPGGNTLYVALSNRDAVAAIDVRGHRFAVRGYFDTRLPGQSYFGAEPVALAVNADGSRVYAANMGSDAIAVLDPAKLTHEAAAKGMAEPAGFVPTEWMPISMAFSGGKLYVATDKGKGTGPNNFAQRMTPGERPRGGNTYIATLLYGSLASIDAAEIDENLARWTDVVLVSNRMKAALQKIAFANGASSPIRHIVYIIKENRTYDQILGDLAQNGKPVGNGDAALAMYGEAVTPNEHKLALQFGVLDNFFDSGEVSGDGHVWSNAAIGTDYLEKTWQINYRNGERPYDFEGVVADGYPLTQNIPDVNQPASGYLWGNLAAHGKTYYHFGEYISSTFCNQKAVADPKLGPMLSGPQCAEKEVAPGQTLPAAWGGGVNRWPWAIPLLAADTATKPELVGHFAPEAPDFNLAIPDQIRVNVFLKHFA
ncbi:MAG: phosphoesterase, partial [Acidobacteriota bacterium]